MRNANDHLFTFLFLAVTAGLTFFDVYADLQEGSSLEHISLEILVIAVAVFGALYALYRLKQTYRQQIHRTQTDLKLLEKQSEQWRNEAQKVLQGLSKQVDQQFSVWKYSNSEKEIALLLIKGLSIKEIAQIREVQEKTIRQQCTSIYKKSNLAGRAELAAFFLEDLMLPASS